MFFESYTEKLWGRHPRNISAAWGAQRVKGLSLFAVFADILHKMLPSAWKNDTQTETSLIESFMYPKYGPGQLWQIASTQIVKMGGKIIFNAKARALKRNDKGICSIIYENEGTLKEFKCDYVISSMPLKDLVLGMNDVPNDIRKIADGLPYRDFVTVGLLIDRMKLRNATKLKTLNNIIPDCWIYIQDKSVKLGRIQIFNNWSPYMVKSPNDTIWLGLEYFCNEGDEQWGLAEDEWMKKGVFELVKIGVLDENVVVRDFHVEKVKKAYPAYFDTYSQIDKLITFLNSIKNLYCVGRNGQHRYNNMDHSMVTAFKAVESILSGGFSDKSEIWNVNTEMEYHEEK
jgi:protoporphyrinogen oxidase